MTTTDIMTLPVRLAARGIGLARGTLQEGRRLVREAAAPDTTESAEHHRGPVNVHDELGLDPAPAPRRRAPRRPAVTGIDQQAEPRLVESTPADVAHRVRKDDAGAPDGG